MKHWCSCWYFGKFVVYEHVAFENNDCLSPMKDLKTDKFAQLVKEHRLRHFVFPVLVEEHKHANMFYRRFEGVLVAGNSRPLSWR